MRTLRTNCRNTLFLSPKVRGERPNQYVLQQPQLQLPQLQQASPAALEYRQKRTRMGQAPTLLRRRPRSEPQSAPLPSRSNLPFSPPRNHERPGGEWVCWHVIRLGGKCLYPLSHLTSPSLKTVFLTALPLLPGLRLWSIQWRIPSRNSSCLCCQRAGVCRAIPVPVCR